MSDLRLGLIGFSEGNGHPFSWSAICNGYNIKYMEKCGFPAIPQYLSEQDFPSARLNGVKVTHVWTQDDELSQLISNASCIPHVVTKHVDMIGHVDAILLATDDAENHYAMAKPFIDAGLAIYIDKPVAYTVNEAKKIFSLERYEGQIFTCSALSYAEELMLTSEIKDIIGEPKYIRASSPKAWCKYSIHLIEPVLKMLNGDLMLCSKNISEDIVNVSIKSGCGLLVDFSVIRQSSFPISIQLFGQKGSRELVFKDSFNCFKNALQDFTRQVESGTSEFSQNQCLRAISVVEMGLN